MDKIFSIRKHPIRKVIHEGKVIHADYGPRDARTYGEVTLTGVTDDDQLSFPLQLGTHIGMPRIKRFLLEYNDQTFTVRVFFTVEALYIDKKKKKYETIEIYECIDYDPSDEIPF